MKNNKEIERYKGYEAEKAKMILIGLEDKLREAGGIREANSLRTIIGKLEAWQNK